jgi:hypothetical protein
MTEVIATPAPRTSAIQKKIVSVDAAHPDGWLKDLDGVEHLPDMVAKAKDRTPDMQFFF